MHSAGPSVTTILEGPSPGGQAPRKRFDAHDIS